MPASEGIHALTYSSQATAALTQDELERVLLRSRTINAARGITGVLVTCGGAIVQYLEGPPASLDRTYPAIAASRLHRDLRLLARATHVARRFDRWHMGFARFEPMQACSEEAAEWMVIIAMLRADPEGNPAFDALLDRWDAIARVPARRRHAV